jgi:hypothetical protein
MLRVMHHPLSKKIYSYFILIYGHLNYLTVIQVQLSVYMFIF